MFYFLSFIFILAFSCANLMGTSLLPLPGTPLFLISGTLVYPITFLISDLVTEIWGKQRAFHMIGISFSTCLIIFLGYSLFFGIARLSGMLIVSSFIAFSISQLADISLFQFIKNKTKGRFLWLRNQLSTYVSQLLDTLIINSIFLFGGLSLSFHQALPVFFGNLIYKVAMTLVLSPVLYLCVYCLRHAGYEKKIS